VSLPCGLRAEDRCPDCDGWHLSGPTHCANCGAKFCALVLERGMCLACDLTDVAERGLRCERDDAVEAPREGCDCLTCSVSRIVEVTPWP
jgi:hypothetical protein